MRGAASFRSSSLIRIHSKSIHLLFLPFLESESECPESESLSESESESESDSTVPNPQLIREGEPVRMMLFIIRGELESIHRIGRGAVR